MYLGGPALRRLAWPNVLMWHMMCSMDGFTPPPHAWTSKRIDVTHGAPQIAQTVTHRDSLCVLGQDTDRFCRGTLCEPGVVEYVDSELLCWGGDISQPDAYRLNSRCQIKTFAMWQGVVECLAGSRGASALLDGAARARLGVVARREGQAYMCSDGNAIAVHVGCSSVIVNNSYSCDLW